METKALALIQIEQPDEARALLEESIRLQPDQGASKYLYLGQMSFGEDAAQALGKGIELLAVELDEISQMSTQEDIQELQDQIAAAFCSLAEVYLTDLWFVWMDVPIMHVVSQSFFFFLRGHIDSVH